MKSSNQMQAFEQTERRKYDKKKKPATYRASKKKKKVKPRAH